MIRIKIINTTHLPKIEVLYFGADKEITVSVNHDYKRILADFITILHPSKIPKIEAANTVDENIIQCFVHIVRQIDAQVSPSRITDLDNELILEPKNTLSRDTIARIAGVLFGKIQFNMLKAPDFNTINRGRYRKIKNFIYNSTKIKMSDSEVDIFIEEISKL